MSSINLAWQAALWYRDQVRPKAVQAYFEAIARKGGKARAAKLTKKERQDIARTAAKARWAKKPEQK